MVEKVASLTVENIKKVQWAKLFHMYYVEPVVFALLFAHSLSVTIFRNQVIFQACTTVFNYNLSVCEELGTKNLSEHAKSIETEIQPYVANLFMVRTLLESIIPALCGVFIGSWSDHYGRKPLLLISMIGFSFTYVITAIICQLSVYYPVNPWYYIIAVIPHSILGGNCVFSVAAFCFISDITDRKTRPYRMLFLEANFYIGLMAGSVLSSFVYELTNAMITFVVSAIIMCTATIYIAVCVPESLVLKKCKAIEEKCNEAKSIDEKCNELQLYDKEQKQKDNKLEANTAEAQNDKKEQQTEEVETKQAESKGLFSYMHIKDMLVTCFKKRPYFDRCIIWLVTGTMFLSIFVIDGAMTVFYLFVREKFQWTVRDFTFYETLSHLVSMVGAIVGFLILRKVFKLSVVTLSIISFFSDAVCSAVRGVATEPWQMYLSIALGVFRSIGGPMCRTIVSNIVPATDLGKIFSIKNVLQSIAPFLAAPLYTFIYQQSLTTYPGLFNIVSAFLYLIAFVFLIIVFRFKCAYKDHYGSILK